MLGLVIGDSNMVSGFRLVGVEGTEVNSVDEAKKALDKAIARRNLAIVIVSEEFSSQPQLQKSIELLRRESVSPLVVEVPASRGRPSEIHLSDLISKTLGINI